MKIKLTIISLFICNLITSQNLSFDETINYINQKLKQKSEITLNKNGILTYSKQYKNYYSTYNGKLEDFTITNKIHIADLKNISLSQTDYRWNDSKQYGYSEEWTVNISCIDKIFHIKKGDCISYIKDWYNIKGKELFFSSFDIRTKDGHKPTSEKVRNALLYLLDLAKEKGYDIKEYDDDPFASNNFNEKKVQIDNNHSFEKIKLKSKNGVYYINASIGNIAKEFILDTGASDVLISKEYEKELINNGVLKKENYITDGLYKIADGSVIRCRRLLIPKLKIGGYTLLNVKTSVVNSGNTMLLGQSVLDRFESWKINNKLKTLELNK